MKHLFVIFALSVSVPVAWCQTRILHYSETSGYDHNTRSQSLAMLQAMGATNGFLVDDDATGDLFNSISTLQEYSVIVFSNTSGNAILDAFQRTNFEQYINSGGSYLGIHAASDTYRHSSANGNNTGTWDFYAELVGASVQESPNHVSGTPQYSMAHIADHRSTDNIPDPWVKNEEYYYWENGYFGNNNTVVLEVEETIGPNNIVNSYDAARPMSWYRLLPQGGKMFYTALGHSASDYVSDQLFINHIEDALLWILDPTVGIGTDHGLLTDTRLSVQNGIVSVWSNAEKQRFDITIANTLGQITNTATDVTQFDHTILQPGVHLIRLTTADQVHTTRLLVH